MGMISKAAAVALALTASAASGATLSETTDFGDTIGTATNAVGYDRIQGQIDTDSDIDVFRIYISNPDLFATTMTSDLTEDNDTEFFLFNSALELVLFDDDGGFDLMSQFNAGELAGQLAGFYYFAITIYDAIASDGGNISVIADPPQTGPYTLNFSGIAAVPLPATLPLLLATLGGLGLVARRRKTA